MNHNFWLNELARLEKDLLSDLNAHWVEGKNDWSPTRQDPTLLELTRQVAALPEAYALILSGASDEHILEASKGDQAAFTVGDLAIDLQAGMRAFSEVFLRYPEIDMKTRDLQHPLGEPQTAVQLTMNLITGLHHLRGQLHLYLNMLAGK